MNKKVQNTKKSIFVAGVLSLSAFAMLGLGAVTLSPTNVYAETPVAQFSAEISGLTDDDKVTNANHSTKVAYVTSSTSSMTVKYSVTSSQVLNGTQFTIPVPTGFSFASYVIPNAISANADFTSGTEAGTYKFVWAGYNSSTYSSIAANTTTELVSVTYNVSSLSSISTGVANVFNLSNITACQSTSGSNQLTDLTTGMDKSTQDEYVRRAPSTISITAAEKTYDGEAADIDDITYTHSTIPTTAAKTNVTYSVEWYQGTNAIINTKMDSAPVDAGTYYFLLKSTDGYLVSAGTSSKTAFTINQADVTITADDKTSTYNTDPKTLTNTVTNGQIYSGDTVTVSYKVMNGANEITLSKTTPAGTYTIVPSATNANYNITLVNGTYTVSASEANEISALSVSDIVYLQGLTDLALSTTATFGADTATYTFATSENGTYSAWSDFVTANKGTGNYLKAGTYYVKASIAATTDYNACTKTASFTVAKAKLTAITASTVSYNGNIATVTAVTTEINGRTIDITPTYNFKLSTTSKQNTTSNSYTATATGTYTVTVETTDVNYDNSDAYTLAEVFSLAFAEGTHVYQSSNVVSGVAAYATQYAFNGENTTTVSDPTLTGYSFNGWSMSVAHTIGSALTASTTATATWTVNTHTLTLKYKVDNGTYTTLSKIASIPTNATFVSENAGETDYVLSGLTAKTWFTATAWFTDENLSTVALGTSMPDSDTTFYAAYNFNIGLGDVNGNGTIDTADLTIYRKAIVGGYELNSVTKDNEINTTSQGATKDFLKRVADVNVQSDGETFGDGNLDVRDVCTIAMALAGGYGLEVSKNADNHDQVSIKAEEEANVSITSATMYTANEQDFKPSSGTHFGSNQQNGNNGNNFKFEFVISSDVAVTLSDISVTYTETNPTLSGNATNITYSNNTLTFYIPTATVNVTCNTEGSVTMTIKGKTFTYTFSVERIVGGSSDPE